MRRLHFVTFDLRGATDADYHLVYEFAHQNGGYRYQRLRGGKWGRLPTTSVVIPLDGDTKISALESFRQLLDALDLVPSHIAVAAGVPAFLAVPVPAESVPDYACPPSLFEAMGLTYTPTAMDFLT